METFDQIVQRQKDNIHQFETCWDAVNGSRGEATKARAEQLAIEDTFGTAEGSNQAARDKWLRERQKDSTRRRSLEADITNAAAVVAENEGRREALKYTIRLTERELEYAIAQKRGTNND